MVYIIIIIIYKQINKKKQEFQIYRRNEIEIF